MQRKSTEEVIRILSNYFKSQPVVQQAWLFGSYARGEQTLHSDVDVIILPNSSVQTSPIIETASHFARILDGMQQDLQQLLGCEVELIPEAELFPSTRKRAERERILIYSRSFR